ncbi:hypothetical protein D3C78_1604650 [compost metagenome]
MVSESHSIITNQIHESEVCLTQILVEVKRSGEYITCIKKNRVLCSCFSVFDCRYTAQDVIW